MNETKIKVLKVEPMKHPEEVMLNNTLRALQAAVGGLIEIANLEDDVCLLCNEGGKLIDLPGNRRVGDDIIAGTFYVCGSDLCWMKTMARPETSMKMMAALLWSWRMKSIYRKLMCMLIWRRTSMNTSKKSTKTTSVC